MSASIEWLTTRPNPRVVCHTADSGQRGWRVHAVEISDSDKQLSLIEATSYVYSDGVRSSMGKRALCGLRPQHGWGMDLFIEQRCAKCERASDHAGTK